MAKADVQGPDQSEREQRLGPVDQKGFEAWNYQSFKDPTQELILKGPDQQLFILLDRKTGKARIIEPLLFDYTYKDKPKGHLDSPATIRKVQKEEDPNLSVTAFTYRSVKPVKHQGRLAYLSTGSTELISVRDIAMQYKMQAAKINELPKDAQFLGEGQFSGMRDIPYSDLE
jgi:hypothetical protein